jgi:hypothetical protein
LLTVSIPDLKPNSQDTSAFYLKNIYQLSSNPNISHPSIPSAFAEPPAFSPPNYAIWVNSLWFLSLALSLSCATDAVMIRNGAFHYFEITRGAWDTPLKRARNRAFFSKGDMGPYWIYGTAGHGYLHLSLLLFIIGGLIYLFNLNPAAFYAVVWWVGFMAVSYAAVTVDVFFNPYDLFHTPFSSLALRIYLAISYVVFQVCSCIPPLHGVSENTRRRYHDLGDRYSKGILRGKRKTANEITSKPSSEIDDLILKRILLTLDEDHALEEFFDAIPGFCKSKLSVMPLSFLVRKQLRPALDGFLDRTLSSNLVSESVRAKQLITSLNAADAAFGPSVVSRILRDILNGRWIEVLQSVEIGHALRLWGHRWDHDLNVRRIIARIVARAHRRDDRWTMLVKEAFGVPDGVLQDSLAHGDSVLLAILIHISRQANRAGSLTSGILSSLSNFDICNTLPRLQNDFRTLWNEISQESRDQGPFSIPAQILFEIGHLHVALHRGTDAAQTAFSASTDSLYSLMDQPSSYPLGDVPSHRQSSTISTLDTSSPNAPSLTQLNQSPAASPLHSSVESDHGTGGGTASEVTEEANVVAEPPLSPDYTPHPGHTRGFTSPPLATDSAHIDRVACPSVPESTGTAITCDPDLLVPREASQDPRQSAPSARAEIAAANFVQSNDPSPQMKTSESGDISQAPVAPSLIFQHPDPVLAVIMPSTGPDPVGDTDAMQDTSSSVTLSHPLQGTEQEDTVAPCAAPDISDIPSTVYPNPRSIPIASPAIVVSDSPLSPNLFPALSSGVTTAEPPSFVESAPLQPDHNPHALRSPSSSLTASSLDTHNLNLPIPMTILLHSDQTAPPVHDIVAATLQPGDQIQHDLDNL